MSDSLLNRRQAIAALAYSTTFPLMSACTREPTASSTAASSTAALTNTEADAIALLDAIGDNLLRLAPETATSLGIDTGARAELRSQLADRSAAGTAEDREQVRADLERANAIDAAGLPHATRTSVEVVRSAYATALEGFALPYGDVPVGGWRNTPYVVIQNVGAYLDVPRFLDSRSSESRTPRTRRRIWRDCSRTRSSSMGSSAAFRRHARTGSCRRRSCSTRRWRSSASRSKNAREGGSLVESIERRTKNIPGNWAERARAIAAKEVAPALERQIGGTAGAARDRDRRCRACGRVRTARSITGGR